MHDSLASKRLIFIVLAFFLILNFISSGGHTDQWDGVVTFLITESMGIKHSPKLHPDIPTVSKSNPADNVRTMVNYEIGNYKALTGKYFEWLQKSMPAEAVYSTRSLLLPAIAVPFYYAALPFLVSPILLVAFFVNSFIIALTSLVVFCFSLEIYGSKMIAFILSLIFGICSFALPYNTSLFPQPLQTLLIITAAFFIYKSLHFHSSYICNYARQNDKNKSKKGKNKGSNNKEAIYFAILGGLFLGFSVFAHPTSIIVIPGFIVYSIFCMRRNKKSLGSFLATLAMVLFLMSLVNYLRFGSFTEFGYGSYMGTLSFNHSWTGLIGLLASPGKGLFFYFPIVILLPIALKYMYKKNRWLSFLILYIVLVHWLYFGTIDDSESRFWSGAIAWGPRSLLPVLPFITLSFGTLLTHLKDRSFMKISIIALCAAGFITNLPGILVWSEYGTIYGWDKEQLYKASNSLEIMTWNPYYSPIILHMKVLVDDYVSDIPVEQYRYTSWHYATYGLAPCSYDLYIFCKFGLTPILVLSAINIILGLKILDVSIAPTIQLSRIRLRDYFRYRGIRNKM
jgi:hypothetical protein